MGANTADGTLVSTTFNTGSAALNQQPTQRASSCPPERAPVSILGDPTRAGPMVILCEHAGNLLPPLLEADSADRRWLATHWGYDLGARDLVEALVARTGAVAICAEISRLVCDANRPLDDPTLIVDAVEGQPLGFNRGIDAAERARRIELHGAYHRAVDQVITRREELPGPFFLLSIHSFTPLYLGEMRDFHVGVLFDERAEHCAQGVAESLTRGGLDARLNQPYSGHDGLIYSAWRHGRAHELLYLELELRQDLLTDPARLPDVADLIARSTSALG